VDRGGIYVGCDLLGCQVIRIEHFADGGNNEVELLGYLLDPFSFLNHILDCPKPGNEGKGEGTYGGKSGDEGSSGAKYWINILYLDWSVCMSRTKSREAIA